MKRFKGTKLTINKTTIRSLGGHRMTQVVAGALVTRGDDCVSMDLCTSNFTWKCAPDR